MGLCGSSVSEADKAGMKENTKADRVLVRKQEEENKIIKLLLLGTGESGKSTIFKQMQVLYDEKGFSEYELQTFRQVVRRNVVESMQVLLLGCEQFQFKLRNPRSDLSGRVVLALDPLANDFWVGDVIDHIKHLWANEPAIKKAYDERSKLQLLDSAVYFFENVDRIGSAEYTPTRDDILRARLRTSGIVERTFNIQNVNFKFLDVGGQRNERRKWIHCFDQVTAIIFMTAVSEYDQCLYEDEKQNRLHESLQVFSTIANNPVFSKSTILLFLNKIDLFEDKIKRVSLKVAFPEYSGDNSFQNASEYITNKYLELSNDKKRLIFAHLTCATDTKNVSRVFEACKITILSSNLEKLGLD
jgi:GTPase SAR1 family protein